MKFCSYARRIAPGLYLVRLTWRGGVSGRVWTDPGILVNEASRARAFDLVRRGSLYRDIAPLYGGGGE